MGNERYKYTKVLTNFSSIDENINDKSSYFWNNYNLKIVKSIISKIERSLYERDFDLIQLYARYLYEVLAVFAFVELDYVVDKFDDGNQLKLIYDKWMESYKKIKEKYEYTKPTIYQLISAMNLTETYKLNSHNSYSGKKFESFLQNQSNEFMHITNIDNFKKMNSGKNKIISGNFIYETFHFNQISYEDAINLLSESHNLIKNFIKLINDNLNIENKYSTIEWKDFDDEIYSKLEMVLKFSNKFESEEELQKIENGKFECEMCRNANGEHKGILKFPEDKDEKWIFGPYLKCNYCKAITSGKYLRENSKNKSTNINCDVTKFRLAGSEINCSGEIKNTIDLDSTSKEKIKKCNYCGK